VALWDAHNGRALPGPADETSFGPTMYSAGFSANSAYLVTAGLTSVDVWQVRDGTLLATMPPIPTAESPVAATFSPDGQSVAVASISGFPIEVWNWRSGNAPRTLGSKNPAVWPMSVMHSPDGSLLLTVTSSGIAQIWNAHTGARIAQLQGHTAQVNTAAFSPDSQYVVTGSGDRTARIWQARSGLQLAVLQGHAGPLLSVAFSPDGTFVVTGSADGTARLYRCDVCLPAQSLLHLAASRGSD